MLIGDAGSVAVAKSSATSRKLNAITGLDPGFIGNRAK